MDTKEVATKFVDLCKAGKFEDAGHQFWSDDIVSLEPMQGEMARMQGKKAIEGKGKWWSENHVVHGAKVEGPFVHGDQFTVRFEFDVTPKGEARTTMREIGLYTVKKDKVVEERFFF